MLMVWKKFPKVACTKARKSRSKQPPTTAPFASVVGAAKKPCRDGITRLSTLSLNACMRPFRMCSRNGGWKLFTTRHRKSKDMLVRLMLIFAAAAPESGVCVAKRIELNSMSMPGSINMMLSLNEQEILNKVNYSLGFFLFSNT